MRVEKELGKRARDVLAAVVRQYVSKGVPVGSKAVARRLTESVSPATVRNCMAELERQGFLEQPHTSAGRVPTDTAYRFYVDRVLGPTRLAPATEKFIDESMGSGDQAPEDLMVKASRVLSEVSRNVGLVLGPPLEDKLLEHIKFVRLSECRVLAVTVSKPDLVENRVIHLEEDVSQQELDRTADFLNTEFQGWSLRAIRLEVFKRMEEMKQLCDHLITNVANLFAWGALGGEESGQLFVEGTSKMLDQPEFEDVSRIRELLSTLEEKAKLIKILNACLQSSAPGVRIFIGRENPTSEMRHCTLIVAPYHYRDRVVGARGVVGPKRMEYDRAITAVDYVAHLCSKLLSTN